MTFIYANSLTPSASLLGMLPVWHCGSAAEVHLSNTASYTPQCTSTKGLMASFSMVFEVS